MKITLYLGADSYLRHNEIITLPEEKVEFEFKNTAHSFGEKILTVRNGETERQYKLADKPVDITDFCTIPGRVEACVSLVVRGEVARTWQVEPLCVKKIEGGFAVIPEIEDIKARIRLLEQAVTETVSIIEN